MLLLQKGSQVQISNRPRRNRKHPSTRNLIRENVVTTDDLIAPLFFIEGKDQVVPIPSMPGQFRYSLDKLVKKVKELESLGINCVSLFPAIDEKFKTSDAKESYNPDGLNQLAIKEVKSACPDMLVMTDIALDPYSSDGHDGIVSSKSSNLGEILNDETLEVLAKMALVQARAGSDILGPSDMMDGRIGFIRNALESEGLSQVQVMAYTAKYASSFYGPFRDALDSAPKAGDKKTYQMDFANSNEALRELYLDEEEGADIVMVKPGLSYLDIIQKLKENTTLPVAAYNVSGEYAMVKAAALNGWLDGEAVMIEMLTSFKRAGADIILTYFAEEMARLRS
jgi:porphobilinogen synthase